MPHTLLLADDSVTIQRVIELTFADEDVRVVAVSNGDEAIAFVDRTPPDIVLADVGMPGRSGYEVAQHIKRTPRLAHIPVLLLTGAFEPVDQAQVAAVGSDGVLAKPFEPQLVIGRVRELLAKRSQQAAAAPPAPPPQPAGGSNDYFDRLDQAFASLGASKPAESAARPPAAAPSDVDWFPKRTRTDQPAPPTWEVPSSNVPDLPLTPPPAFDRLGDLGITPVPPVPAPAPPVPERAFAPPQAAPSPPAAPAPEVVVTQDLVDRVASRVLEQLSDHVVRETVTDIISAVAERLVRESAADTVSAVAERLVRESAADTVSAIAERLVRESAADTVSAVAERLVREGLADTVSAIAERVVRERVADAVSAVAERLVRERVADTVAAVAERLVGQEIERIKSTIK